MKKTVYLLRIQQGIGRSRWAAYLHEEVLLDLVMPPEQPTLAELDRLATELGYDRQVRNRQVPRYFVQVEREHDQPGMAAHLFAAILRAQGHTGSLHFYLLEGNKPKRVYPNGLL